MRNKGFTLVEVLIAVALVAILLSTVYGVFTSVAGAKQRLESEGEGYHQARVFFDRIGRELRGAYFPKGTPPTAPGKQPHLIGGFNEEKLPFLELTTTADTPYGGQQGGISVVRYELFSDREAPVGDETRVLMRNESSIFDSTGAERSGYRLATGIGDMKVRYQKNGQWHEEYDTSKNGGLPQAVEVTLTLPVGGSKVPFSTTFDIPAAR